MQIQTEQIAEILKFSEPCSSYEGILQARWNHIPLNTQLHLADKTPFSVLSRGVWNFEAGPDFKNAKLQIGSTILYGDVEIHRTDRDWFRHGHDKNPLYSNVILHAVEQVETAPVPDNMPIYLLPAEKKLDNYPPPLLSVKGLCADKFERIAPENIHELFACAGRERMHARAQVILHDMIKAGMERAFLTRLFDAYGFKRNRKAFGELLNRLWDKYSREELEAEFEPLIWGESGLLPSRHSGEVPEENLEEAKRMWARWWHLRPDSAPPIDWKRDGGRPLNSPERRTAGLCLFLSRYGMNPLPGWLRLLKESESAITFCKELLAGLIQNDTFWNSHTTFRAGRLKYAAAVTGEERARELAADVIMPALRAAAMLEKNEKMMDRVDAAFNNLPRTQKNRVFTSALEKWFKDPATAEKWFKDAALRQGVHHIYTSYCTKIACDCSACLIHNAMFAKV